jgi:hypothetical protein
MDGCAIITIIAGLAGTDDGSDCTTDRVVHVNTISLGDVTGL